ncbi:hypothetical protein ACFWPV_20085 [Streptomyces uncialis]|uniref:hypothetical protein n=1 Tax=Streptomyces uncialis TaxID=1048205 RepID=UPI003669C0AA
MAQLLAESVEVRAAARLDHELQDAAPVWRSEWSAALQNLLEKAKRQGTSPADLEAIELLATYLVVGAEAAIRAGAPYSSVQEQLTRLWTLIDVDEVDPSDSQGQHPGRVALL